MANKFNDIGLQHSVNDINFVIVSLYAVVLLDLPSFLVQLEASTTQKYICRPIRLFKFGLNTI